jgi:hypothetical protein
MDPAGLEGDTKLTAERCQWRRRGGRSRIANWCAQPIGANSHHAKAEQIFIGEPNGFAIERAFRTLAEHMRCVKIEGKSALAALPL